MTKHTTAIIAAAALALPASAAAQSLTARYDHAYHAVAHRFGARAPGRNILRDGMSTGGRATSGDLHRSLGVLRRMLAPAPTVRRTDGDGDHDGDVSDRRSAAAPARRAVTPARAPAAAPSAPTTSQGGGYASVPGVPASFAACVALRESSNGADSPNIYGIIPASGYSVAGLSVAQQKAVFARLYAKDGTAPWSPYDGCR